MEPSDGRGSVSFANSRGFAGYSGRDGLDLVCYWHFWIGCLFRQQTLAGIGNSYGPRRAAQGSVAGSVGTRTKVAGFWFRGRIAPRNSGQPGARLHRVSGNSPRPEFRGAILPRNQKPATLVRVPTLPATLPCSAGLLL